MTPEEEETIVDELAYWLDDGIETRLDSEYARITRVYEGIQAEESEWQQVTILIT